MEGDKNIQTSSKSEKVYLAPFDTDCTKTLKELKELVKNEHMGEVFFSTTDRALRKYLYTLKNLTMVPEKKNCGNTKKKRVKYVQKFRVMETTNEKFFN